MRHQFSGFTLFIATLLFLAFTTPVRAATNRYVVNPGSSCSTYGSYSPCYTSIQNAVAAAANGDTVIILENMAYGFYDYTTTVSSLTIKGLTSSISVPALRIPKVNNWIIQDLKVTDAIIVTNVSTKLRVANIQTNGIYVKPSLDMTAIIEIVNNKLPTGKVCASNTAYCDIGILGAEGKTLGGTITIQNNIAGALNVFANINNTNLTILSANVIIDGNTFTDTADVGIRANPGTTYRGAGNITGNIVFSNNIVTNISRGLNVTVDSNTHGNITGNITFTNNDADKIACITYDASTQYNNAMSGNLTITGNIGEVIEMGFRGDFSGSAITIQNNNLTYKGGEFGSSLTVRANTFASTTTIQVGDNSGLFGVVFDTFTGANNATTNIYRNTTYYIVYTVATTNGGTFTISDNTISAGPYPANPVNNPDWGHISIVSDTGALANGNILNNTAPKLYVSAGTNISGSLIFQGNTIAGVTNLVAQGTVGTGIVTMTSNRLGTASTDSLNFTRINAEVHWNAIMGPLYPSASTVNAQRNWWGCNGGPGNSACQSVPVPNSAPFLTFEANLVCTGANTKIVAGYHLTKDSNGVYWQNVTVPGSVILSSNTGTISSPNPKSLKAGFSWNSTIVNVAANATANVIVALDRQSIPLTKTCQTRTDTIGRYTNGQFYLQQSNTTASSTIAVSFGNTGWLPVTGDWDSDGVDTIGGYDSATGVFYLRNSNISGNAEMAFVLGNPGDTPMAGRWDPTMTNDGVGVFRPTNGIIYLKRNLQSGFSDYFMILGNPGDAGVAGDWDGDGYDGPGVYRPSLGRWYLSNNGTASGIIFDDGFADLAPAGNTAVRPVVGDWDADGMTGIGYLLNGMLYLRNTPTGTNAADMSFALGQTGDYPLAGHWTSTVYDPALMAVNGIIVRGANAANTNPSVDGAAD